MPIVPIQQNEISTGVPGADLGSPAQYGRVGMAIANTSAQITDSALSLSDKIMKADAVEKVNKKMSERQIESMKYWKELEMSSPDGYVYDGNATQENPRGKIVMQSGKPLTIAQKYRDWANSNFEADQKEMPSAYAQDLYKAHALDFYSKEMSSAQISTYSKMTEFWKTNREDTKKNIGNALFDNPDLNGAHGLFSKADGWNQYVHRSAEAMTIPEIMREPEIQDGYKQFSYDNVRGEIDKLKNEKAVAKMAWGNGWINKGLLGSIDDMIDLLSPNPNRDHTINPNVYDPQNETARRRASGLPTLDTMLDPKDKAHFVEQLIAMKSVKGSSETNDWHKKTEDLRAAFGNLGPNKVPRDAIDEVINQGLQLVQNKKSGGSGITDYDFSREVGGIITAKVVATQLASYSQDPNALALLSSKQKQAMEKRAVQDITAQTTQIFDSVGMGSVGKIAGQTFVADYRKQLNEFTSRQRSSNSTDLASEVAKNDPVVGKVFEKIDPANALSFRGMEGEMARVQGRIEALRKNASTHGEVWSTSNLPLQFNNFSQRFADQLKNSAQGIDAGVKYVDASMKLFGKSWASTINDLVDSNKLPAEYTILGYMNSSLDKRDVLATVWGEKSFQKRWDDMYKGKSWESDLLPKVSAATQDYQRGIFQQDPYNIKNNDRMNMINRIVSMKAGLLMMDNGMSADEAAKAAAEQFVTRHFGVQNTGGRSLFDNNAGFLAPRGQDTKVVLPRFDTDGTPLSDKDHEQLVSWSKRMMAPAELMKLPIEPPKGIGAIGQEKLVEWVQKHGRMTFGVDPNGSKKTGWYIRTEYQSNKNVITREPLRITGENNKSVVWFVPARQALGEQNDFEKGSPPMSWDYLKNKASGAASAVGDAISNTAKKINMNKGTFSGGKL